MKVILSLFLTVVLLNPALATVSIEFQLGSVNVPAGALGVLVADVGANSFQSPTSAAGAVLTPGQKIGADDVILAVFSNANLSDWGTRRGFAEQLAVIDYEAFGVASGQNMILYVFPARVANDTIRVGEPHLAYRSEDLGDFTANSSMGFALPADGGAYLLATLGSDVGGNADLTAMDIAPFPGSGGNGLVDRSLTQTARHTYYFDLASAGPFSLIGRGVAGLRAALYDPSGQELAASDGSGGFAFNENLGTGFHRLVVFQSPGGSGALDYELDFTSSGLRLVRPDVEVGLSLTSLIGSGIYGTTSGQQIALVSKKARAVTGFATVANDISLPDVVRVSASPGSNLFSVVYMGAAGNMTAGLVSGSFKTEAMDENDAPLQIVATITPNKKKIIKRGKKVYRKKSYSTTVRAISDSNPSVSDLGVIGAQTR